MTMIQYVTKICTETASFCHHQAQKTGSVVNVLDEVRPGRTLVTLLFLATGSPLLPASLEQLLFFLALGACSNGTSTVALPLSDCCSVLRTSMWVAFYLGSICIWLKASNYDYGWNW